MGRSPAGRGRSVPGEAGLGKEDIRFNLDCIRDHRFDIGRAKGNFAFSIPQWRISNEENVHRARRIHRVGPLVKRLDRNSQGPVPANQGAMTRDERQIQAYLSQNKSAQVGRSDSACEGRDHAESHGLKYLTSGRRLTKRTDKTPLMNTECPRPTAAAWSKRRLKPSRTGGRARASRSMRPDVLPIGPGQEEPRSRKQKTSPQRHREDQLIIKK